jgi:hypothetical protein
VARHRHGGVGHDFKVGANFINEPRLFITFKREGAARFTHLDNTLTGPISQITIQDGDGSANIPTKQFAVYFQDDWRVKDRLTINAGSALGPGHRHQRHRPDGESELHPDSRRGQSRQVQFAAGAVGDLSQSLRVRSAERHNNFQPRIGAVLDLRGNGRDILRGGFGTYTDFGYTNSNVLFAAVDASGKTYGAVFDVNNPTGIRNPDGSFYRVGQSLDSGPKPEPGDRVEPAVRPVGRPAAADAVPVPDERGLLASAVERHRGQRRLRLLARPRPQHAAARESADARVRCRIPRRIAAIVGPAFNPNSNANRPAISAGKSEYEALILGLHRRCRRASSSSSATRNRAPSATSASASIS